MRAHGDGLLEAIAILRDRLEAEEDKQDKAVLSWQIGHLHERAGDPAAAVKAYLGAYNFAPGFRPPLFDLIRIFERRRSFKNLARLYDAEETSAHRTDEAASAAADLAALIEDREKDVAKASHRLAEVLTRADALTDAGPGVGAAAHFLERVARRTGDADLITQALEARIAAAADPTYRVLLLIDLAEHEAEGGAEADVDRALARLQEAREAGAVAFRVLQALERVARKHERTAQLVDALEGLGDLGAAATRGERTPGSGAFSVERFDDAQRTRARAGAYYVEAAMWALRALDDAARGVSLLGRASELCPDDPLLRLLHVEAAFRAGDAAAIEGAAARYLEASEAPEGGGGDGAASAGDASDAEGAETQAATTEGAGTEGAGTEGAATEGAGTEGAASEGAATEAGGVEAPAPPSASDAVLLYYAAQAAAATERHADALSLAGRALALAPDSAVLQATLDAWHLASGEPGAWIEALRARAGTGTDEDRSRAYWRAAEIAMARGWFEQAHELFGSAVERAARPAPILRQWCDAMLRVQRPEEAGEALRQLLSHDLDPDERSAWIFEQLSLRGDEERRPTLRALLNLEATRAWVPDAARLEGALTSDHELLAKAHAAMAERADEDDLAAAHLCAAARAHLRGGHADQAEEVLGAALGRVPGHAYAVALLETLYRDKGDNDAVVRLLREAAEAHGGSRAAVVELLLAGAAAEAAGDIATARETYEQASDLAPESLSPLRALERLARSQGDEALELVAQEGLAEREQSLGDSRVATLEVGEHFALLDKGELAEAPLRAALDSDVGLEAALALTLLPEDQADPAARLSGLETLMKLAVADRRALRREHGQTSEVDALDPAAVEHAIAALAPDEETESADSEPDDPDDLWALLAALGLASEADRSLRGEIWLRLADATRDPDARADLFLHGLRTKLIVEGSEAADDVFLLAQDLGAQAPETPSARAGIDETLEAGDDPDVRAAALLGVLDHASSGTEGPLRAAAGRALTAARRKAAHETLLAVVERDPWDLSAWESLRIAARPVGAWEDVVRACDELSKYLDGEALHALQEEAAAAELDYLGRADEAFARLQTIFEDAPERSITYHRLHDLLAAREDADGLLAVVKRRIDATDEGLERLFYELARLHRARGELDEAIEAIENLVMLDEQHVGGIALAVEIHVSREAWQPAVDGLRLIAKADVPASQKRISRLGAADFLEHKLDDPAGALAELRAVDALGFGNVELHLRMASLAERAGDAKAAAESHLFAAQGTDGRTRAAHARRGGELFREAGEAERAREAYELALSADPADLIAGAALAELSNDPAALQRISATMERSVRDLLASEGLSAERLRSLRDVAAWREDRVFEQTVLMALHATGMASTEERKAATEETSIMNRGDVATLDAARLAQLVDVDLSGPTAEFARLLDPVLCELLELTPGGLGVGRREQVSSHPVLGELTVLGALFDVGETDAFAGGRDASHVRLVPGKKRPAWVIGSQIGTPVHPVHRYLAAQQAAACKLGVTGLVEGTPKASATMLFAAAAASDAPLATGLDRPGLVDWTRRLQKALPRRTRKALAPLAARIPDGGAGLEAFCAALRRATMRAGVLVAGDLAAVVEAMLDEPPNLGAVKATPEVRGLVEFWITPTMIELRRSLGT